MWNKLLIVAALAFLSSCGGYSKKKVAEILGQPPRSEAADMHTAENSLDYAGVYDGVFPAADCPEIEVCLVLYSDGNYHRSMEYIERETGIDEQGTYRVSNNLLTLTPSKPEAPPTYFKIEEGQLRMLDGNMQVIEGSIANDYILHKNR